MEERAAARWFHHHRLGEHPKVAAGRRAAEERHRAEAVRLLAQAAAPCLLQTVEGQALLPGEEAEEAEEENFQEEDAPA